MDRKANLPILVCLVTLFCATATDEAAAQSMTVTPANPTIAVGQTQQFTTPDVSNVTRVEAGDYHVCIVRQSGETLCYGRNNWGQLGSAGGDSATAFPVINLTQATMASAGGFHSCAVLQDHSVKCWGMNDYGQLGDGTTNSATVPVTVSGISTATAVATGYMHSCALLQNGTVKCWGDNTYGQLGDGLPIPPGTTRGGPSTAHSSVPVTVVGIGTAVAVTASDGYHSCAVLQNGTVRCWGDNVTGQLGDGSRTGTSTPITVPGITTAIDVSSGDFHTCALRQEGTVSCWGLNWTGQLGDGTGQDSNTPVQVSGISTAVNVTAGVLHSCAVLQDGTARCWGDNDNGEIGNGTTTNAYVPATVPGITSALRIAGGNNDTCAVLQGGLVRCWGLNTYGELGIGTNTEVHTPTAVVGINPTWTTSNSAVATINATGLATGQSAGSATITASFDFFGADRSQPRQPRSGSTTLGVGDRPVLTVVRAGSGTGTVTSSPAGIDCGATCSASFDPSTAVTLTATALNGTNFAGWSGCDSVSGATCTVTMSAARSITATFTTSTLTVTKAGNGRGTVTSSEPGIDCGPNSTTCAASYSNGTALTLTASPVADSRFDFWSGCDSANAEVCGVTINGSRSVTAAFALLRFTLTVNKAGLGTGTVTSAPAGINCGSTCSAPYDSGTLVTLTATPAPLSVFASWSGCNTVSGATCTVTMSAAKSVTATFNLQQFTLSVQKTGIGSGTVTSAPGGISCGSTCSAPYNSGTVVTLTATPGMLSMFNGWIGCDTSNGTTCAVTMSAAKSVTADFVGVPLP